jgi:hypothetical protein
MRKIWITTAWLLVVLASCAMLGMAMQKTCRHERAVAAWRARCVAQGGELLPLSGSRYVCVKTLP